MSPHELRRAFLDFFISKGHAEIPSASLIPENDPTVLFTTAGMHPLVPYLLGEPHPAGHRLTNVQKCIRTGDIDEVGDATHLTFFEMMGNWSLQDYFKKEAIEWSFEFLTSILRIPLSHLAFTVFVGEEGIPRDEQSAGIWEALGVSKERIAFLGREDNWWGPAGQTGPCGPDTEMFYWTGGGEPPAAYDPSDKRWVEIWNDVFMQYRKTAEGKFELLSAPNVDTGMGLERTLAVLTGASTVYDTELFQPILREIEKLTGRSYGESPEVTRGMRIIADHTRAAVMMIADGILPSNKDQGYVLRRLIRRSVQKMNSLGAAQVERGRETGVRLLPKIAGPTISTLTDQYPYLVQDKMRQVIDNELAREESRFVETLSKGLKEFEKIFSVSGKITGEQAFFLFSSFGFPFELTLELTREKGQAIDEDAFAQEFKKHQEISRAGSEKKFAGGLADHSVETTRLHTATHLLHQALRTVLGDHVFQKGSNITAERLRFDFSHPEKVTSEQLQAVEVLVNQVITRDLPVSFEILDLDEAKRRGAIGLFEDTYAAQGNKIKVYTVGDETTGVFSREVCGGPHVTHTGELEGFKILKEEASSQGVRRIKAVVLANRQLV